MDVCGCGRASGEINYSLQHRAWLCFGCYQRRPVKLTRRVELILGTESKSRAEVARLAGRDSKDGSVGRALERLVNRGRAIHDDTGYHAAPRAAVAA
jgi:hypothetical protein